MPSTAQNLFSVLTDPTRRTLFERLVEDGERTVHALTGQSGVTQPAVSKHLRILKRAGLVLDRRAGRETHYRAQPLALLPLKHWISLYGAHLT
jgi:DNA-binding transcriptional ArsR family regulator